MAVAPHPASQRSPVLVFEPPTREMRFWRRLLGPLVYRDHAVGRALRFALVTPLAHVANLSFDYQAYLYEVFHRGGVVRWSHRLLIPLVTTACMAAVMRLDAAAGTALVVALTVWYVAQASFNRLPGLALVMGGVGALVGGLAATWAASATAFTEPGLWAIGGSVVMTLSHAAEPDVPPRTSGGSRWTPIGRFFARDRLPAFLLRATVSAVTGTLNELWGAWRLFPVMVAAELRRAGYARERFATLQLQVDRALASGNPAIDFVGTGGTRSAQPSPAGSGDPSPDTIPVPELVDAILADLDHPGWVLESRRDGVAVYSNRELAAPYVGYRTIVEVGADLDEVTAFLGPGLLDAFSRMNALYVDGDVLREGPEADVVRTRFAMPWPMAGREFVHLLAVAAPADDLRVVAYHGVEGAGLPAPTDGYVRCPIHPSGQRLSRLPRGGTRVEHLMVYGLAGAVPRWAQNHLFHRGHVKAYHDEWRGLIDRFGSAR